MHPGGGHLLNLLPYPGGGHLLNPLPVTVYPGGGHLLNPLPVLPSIEDIYYKVDNNYCDNLYLSTVAGGVVNH